MATTVSLAGTSYSIPSTGDGNYSDDLSAYFIALANNTKVLQTSSSSFALTQDLSFGTSYGLKVQYLKSQASNPASTGIVRLGNAEALSWRNAGNSADLALSVNSSNILQFNGSSVLMPGLGSIVDADVNASAAIAYSKLNLTGSLVNADVNASAAIAYSKLALTNSLVDADVNASAAIAYSKLNLTGALVNADVSASAAIAYSKLALTGSLVNADISASAAIALSKLAAVTASKALVSDASGFISASSVTSTELGHVAGVTSAIQTQIDSKASIASPTFTGTVSGITSSMVGLGNVDNTSDATKNAAAVTLTNKTLTAPVIDIISATEQSSTPASPSAGTRKMYVKNDGKAYLLDSAGTETQLGSGGSSGVNYISNPDAETNTTGWAMYADAAASSPVDGTGGSPSSTFTRSTSSPLRGAASFLLTKSAANRQGEGFSYDFTIAAADKGKVLACSFNYAIASGTYADDDVQFWIYDVTNAVLIQPAPFKLKNHSLISDRMFCEFQSRTDSASYRLIAHIASTSASAYTLKFDDFLLGPQAKLYGSAVTDSESYTGSLAYAGTTATNITSQTYKKSKSGDKLTVVGNVNFNGAANANGAFRIPLPSGLSIDTTKIGSAYQIVGTAVGYFNSSKQFNGHVRIDGNSTTYVTLHKWDDSGASDQDWGGNTSGASNVPGGVAIANGDGLSFTFTVPIVGWSSSQVMSSDADTRVVAARYTRPASVGFTSGSPFDFSTKDYDTHGAVTTGASWKFTAPVSGFFQIDATWCTNGTSALILYKNGSNTQYLVGGITNLVASGSSTLSLNAGDYIDVRTDSSSGTTQVVTAITIKRLSGPAQIAASESVNCRYTTSAGQVIATGAGSVVDFGTKDYDTHGAVTTGASWKFTAPISGKYSVKAMVYYEGTSWTVADKTINLRKNGSLNQYLTVETPDAGLTKFLAISGSGTINLLAGEYIDLVTSHGEASTKALNITSTLNWVTIERVGN